MTRKTKQEISEKIKIFMLKKGLTQRDLAKKLKVSPQTISQFLRGKNALRTDTIEKLAGALGVPNNYFFANSNNNTIGNNNSSSVQNMEIELMKKDIIILKKEVEILKARIKK